LGRRSAVESQKMDARKVALEAQLAEVKTRLTNFTVKRDSAVLSEQTPAKDWLNRTDGGIAKLQAEREKVLKEIQNLSPGGSRRLPLQEAYLKILPSVQDNFVDLQSFQAWLEDGKPLGERLAALLKLSAGTVVGLPEETLFLGSSALKSSIWIHPDYPPLLRAVLGAMAPHEIVYIMDTPDVGKTFLGALLVSFFLLVGFSMVYEKKLIDQSKESIYWLLRLGKHPLRTYDLSEWTDVAWDRQGQLVYVVDGGAPSMPTDGTYPFLTVVFS
jgi:hypothetical protein